MSNNFYNDDWLDDFYNFLNAFTTLKIKDHVEPNIPTDDPYTPPPPFIDGIDGAPDDFPLSGDDETSSNENVDFEILKIKDHVEMNTPTDNPDTPLSSPINHDDIIDSDHVHDELLSPTPEQADNTQNTSNANNQNDESSINSHAIVEESVNFDLVSQTAPIDFMG